MSKQFHPLLKVQYQDFLTLKKTEINRFQSEKFIFVIQSGKIRKKVLQVFFGEDGSLYVSFPYFDDNRGVVCIASYSQDSSTTTINLESTGKVTKNNVKYSHHPDGEVHFSQAGKIKTAIKKKSLPLIDTEGHIFSFSIQGLNHFETDDKLSDITPSQKRTELSFKFDDELPEAIKIVGRWHEGRSLLRHSSGSVFGPIAHGETPDKNRYSMFLVGPPENRCNNNYFLLINCEKISPLDINREGVMIFIGGFRNPNENLIYSKDTFLCALYPIINIDEVEKRIGNIDLN